MRAGDLEGLLTATGGIVVLEAIIYLKCLTNCTKCVVLRCKLTSLHTVRHV